MADYSFLNFSPNHPSRRSAADHSARHSNPLDASINQATHVHQTKIGEVATLTLGSATSTFMMLESLAFLGREVKPVALGGAFHPLSTLFATAFSTYYGVVGMKMLIDGKREYWECRRTHNHMGKIIAIMQMINGGLMVIAGVISGLMSAICLDDILSLHSPMICSIKALLSGLSAVVWGIFAVFEAIRAYREWRNFQRVDENLEEILGQNGDNYETAFELLMDHAVLTREECIKVCKETDTTEEARDQIIELAQAREDVFCLYFGRKNFLRVRDGTVEQAEEIVQACKKHNKLQSNMSLVKAILYTIAILAVIACIVFTGGIPVIAGSIVMSTVFLVTTIINTRQIYLDWENKEIGKWDERILIASMVFFTAVLVTAIFLTGVGVWPLLIFVITGALILTIKAISLRKLIVLRKRREKEVEEANQQKGDATRFSQYNIEELQPLLEQPQSLLEQLRPLLEKLRPLLERAG